jgi:hypothetical protein
MGDNAPASNPPLVWADGRFFVLSWKDSDIEWMFMEDEEARAQALADEAEAETEADTASRWVAPNPVK